MLSPERLLVAFSTPVATFSSLTISALRSGCSSVSIIVSFTTFLPAREPKLMETKFCPINPANLIIALLSVFTLAARSNFSVTSTLFSLRSIFSTRPICTPAILTGSPSLSSCTVLNRARMRMPRLKKSKLPSISMRRTAAMNARAKKIPSRVSSVSFITVSFLCCG